MNAPIKLAALFAGALLVLAQTGGIAEAGHGHKQVQTAANQGQASQVWDRNGTYKQGKAYGKRGNYGKGAYKHRRAYAWRTQRRHANMKVRFRVRRAQRAHNNFYYTTNTGAGARPYQGQQYQGQQHQGQRQRVSQNSNGNFAKQPQQRHITQVWRGNRTQTNRGYSN